MVGSLGWEWVTDDIEHKGRLLVYLLEQVMTTTTSTFLQARLWIPCAGVDPFAVAGRQERSSTPSSA